MSTSPAPAPPRLFGLYVAAFVNTLGMFLVLALLPYYAQRYGAGPSQVGALVAIFAVAQTLSAPLWGRFSDRVGRRPVILGGLLVSTAAYVSFALADSLLVLYLSRFAQGVGGGTVAAVFAYISDAVAPKDRAERIGWVTAATSAAALIGPVVGSLAGQWSPAAPGLFAAVLSVVAFVLCRVALRDRPRAQRDQARDTTDAPGSEAAASGGGLLASIGAVLARPLLAPHRLIWIYGLAMIANTAMTAVAALSLEARFAIGEDHIWVFFAALAGGAMVVRLFVLGRTVRSLGEAVTLRLGAVSLGLGLLLFPLVPGLPGVLATVVLMAFGTSFLFPCTTALLSRAVAPEESGQLLGVQQAYGGASGILGPLAAGAAFGAMGPATPFLGSAAVMILVLGLGLGVRQPEAADG